ncbi:hypothetical protein BLOT_015615 [Blomia tropicalis]|nr:hypothetical protein BLOT_015615 [Blomia tropicalis]
MSSMGNEFNQSTSNSDGSTNVDLSKIKIKWWEKWILKNIYSKEEFEAYLIRKYGNITNSERND